MGTIGPIYSDWREAQECRNLDLTSLQLKPEDFSIVWLQFVLPSCEPAATS